MRNNPKLRFSKCSNDWTETTVGETADIKQGFAFDSKTYNTKGEYRVITISNVGGNRYIRKIDECNRVSYIPNDLQDFQKLNHGDILVSMTGNVGRVSMNSGSNNLLNQRVGVLEPLYDINKQFLFYILASSRFENSMKISGQGAAQLNISNDDINKYIFRYTTDRKEQEQIADFLSIVDSLLEEKKKELVKTMQFKKSMLTKMFPQGDSKVPEIRFKGFDQKWNRDEFGNLYNIFNGLNKEKSAFGFGVNIINYMDVNKNVILTDDKIKGKVNLSTAEINANHVDYGDILFARTSEVIEEVAFSSTYLGNNNDIVFSGFLLKAAPKTTTQINPAFMAYYIRYSKCIRDQITRLATKTSRALINGENIKNIVLLLPEFDEQSKIAAYLMEIDKNLLEKEEEVINLEHLKSALLSKMFA